MAEPDLSAHPHAAPIRSTVGNEIGHLIHSAGIDGPGLIYKAKYAAHEMPIQIDSMAELGITAASEYVRIWNKPPLS